MFGTGWYSRHADAAGWWLVAKVTDIRVRRRPRPDAAVRWWTQVLRVAWVGSVVAGPWASWGLEVGYILGLYRLAALLATSYGLDPRDLEFRRAVRRVVYEGLYGGRPRAAHRHLSPYVRRVRRWVRPTLKVWALAEGGLGLWDLYRANQERRQAEAAAQRLQAFVRAWAAESDSSCDLAAKAGPQGGAFGRDRAKTGAPPAPAQSPRRR